MTGTSANWDQVKEHDQLMVIDPLAEDCGHLLEDDLFWATVFKPVTSQLTIVSSLDSVQRIKRLYPGIDLRPFVELGSHWRGAVSKRLLTLIKMTFLVRQNSRVLLQSFDEVSALWFGTINRKCELNLMVTNNLTGPGTDTWKRTLVQKILFRRARRIFVTTRFEEDLLRKRFGDQIAGRVRRIGYHKIGQKFAIRRWRERKPVVGYFGLPSASRGIEKFLEWSTERALENYSFIIYTNGKGIDEELIRKLCQGNRVIVDQGVLSDEAYYDTIGSMTLVALPFTKDFEGRLSGVLCDAIAVGTPVIASEQEPQTEMFERYGRFGFLVGGGGFEGLKGELQRLEQFESAFEAAMQRARADNSLDTVRRQILSELFPSG